MAFHGSTSTGAPVLSRVKPVGSFIHEFTVMTNRAATMPEMAMGTANQMCVREGKRSQL